MKDNISRRGLLAVAVAITGGSALAQQPGQELEHTTPAVEEIIVTSALHRSRAETVLPVSVLAGEELREKAAATLGDMLQSQPGVNNASFGVGVGLPVIRGQSANRVQVLQGGVGNVDASAVSPDHANSLEPALAERIEVVRGPATLLYGNGAIGGVVNVIDNSIPDTAPAGLSALIETRHNNVSDQQTSVLKLEGGAQQFAWHVDGIDRDSNDTSIPGYAINPDYVDINDPEALEQLLDSRGRLHNSGAQSQSWTLGGSWILDAGYLGMSYSELDSEYGLPAGAHAEHEEEVDHQDDAQAHDEEAGDIRIVMEQQRWDVEGTLPLGGPFAETHGKMSRVDYRHAEVEADGNVGTVYTNEGVEGRLLFHLDASNNREGVVGVQFGSREFAASGAEAFIPGTDIGSAALFTVQSLDYEDVTFEAGLRLEQINMDQAGSCDADDTSFSGSLAAIWRYSDATNLLASVNHSERAATVEERYSNITSACQPYADADLIAHAATQRREVGLPDAELEKSTNLEVAWRRHSGNVTGEVNLFYNAIKDYIYLFDTGTLVDEVEVAQYLQADAVFQGFEAQLGFPLYRSGNHVSDLSLFSDYVKARFDRGGNVPRIPPLRYGFEWTHSHLEWMVKLRFSRAYGQSNVATNETRSSAYTDLSLYADYHIDLDAGSSLLLFARGSNLLDESIRYSTSLLKDVAPAPGRGFEVGLRFEF